MDGTTLILLMLAAFVVFFILSGIKVVRQSENIIIERLGKYHATLEAGINVVWPVIDKPRNIHWRETREGLQGQKMVRFFTRPRIDLRETVYDFPRQNVITKDNVVTEINALLYFQIMDSKKAVYEIENLPDAIEKLTQTTLRNVIGDMDLDETLTSRDTINTKLRLILDDATNKWGVKVNRVELQDINPPRDIRDAMEKQMRAERDRRAKILEAEGEKASRILEAEGVRESDISRAEGEKQASILSAEGEAIAKIQVAKADAEARILVAQAEAEAIRLITETLKSQNADPTTYLLAVKYIETLSQMTSGKDNKVIYMPYEATGVISSLGSIKEMFNKS